METKLKQDTIQDRYPHNLLAAVAERETSLPFPISKDIMAGIAYALSTLDDQEKEILHQRFFLNTSDTDISKMLNIPQESIHQIESKALRKLRAPTLWDYMKLGIRGAMEKRIRSEYSKGYNLGYIAGYKDGTNDTVNGRTHSFCDNEELLLPVEVLAISVRSLNCLTRIGCTTIDDVVRISDERILRARNMGRKSADEIARALKQRGIHHTEWDKYILDD